jgi:hypothetical protein
MNLDILRCEALRLSVLYTQKLMWGIECDVELFENQIITLLNQVWMIENIQNCPIPATLYREIEVCINRLQSTPIASFCNNC